ncbi:MAG: PD40 domain-containing protein [Deltaproteobacteria bacterium]|nr:PD40 domain-containing protein [Deltaproteobacteria bacterium]
MKFRYSFSVLCLSSLCLWLLLSGSVFAQAPERKYTVITGSGQSLYRIAIPPALTLGKMGRKPATMVKVLGNDLELMGLFKVLSPKGFLANLSAEGMGIKAQDWINVGAQAVVKSRVTRLGRDMVVEFLLYDVSKGTAPLLKRKYKGRNARRLAHRFGNDIVKYFTKRKGIFLTKIVFASGSRKRRRSHVYVMDYDGHGAYRLSKTGNQNVLPAFSRSGRIAYTSFLWQNPDLYVVSAGGGRAKRISKRAGLNIGAAWSPGGKIALTMSHVGNSEIFTISSSGEILKRLTNNPGIDASPTWSPSGGQIAFVSNRGGSAQVYVMSSNGGGARRLTFAGNYNQEPSWCPDKNRPEVAFTGRDGKGNYDIFTINVKSGALKRLTQGQGSNKSPSWSPDGRLIAFTSSRGGIWMMNADGLNQRRVYRGGAVTLDWSKSY